jgi:mediator of RNA polymerase II transcription subunit 13
LVSNILVSNHTINFLAKPPGTAESQALMVYAPDCGDVNSSPVGADVMDVSDQVLLPIGFSSFESFNPTSPAVME